LNVRGSDLQFGDAIAVYHKRGRVHNRRLSEKGRLGDIKRGLSADLMNKSTEAVNHEK
jgi:hypothetical protein